MATIRCAVTGIQNMRINATTKQKTQKEYDETTDKYFFKICEDNTKKSLT
jgi:beta-galactosidase beta subunit